MTPDDRRHGTHSGYVLGCRDACCTAAHTVYMKLYRMGRRNRLVSPLGTLRRIEALQCLGWTMQAIALRCGFEHEWIYNLRRSEQVTMRTASIVSRVYDEMSMSLPLERTAAEKAAATKARTRAAQMGWLPPLAWDDIDDPDEQPRRGASRRPTKADIDPIVVERVLAGDRVPTTIAEKREITRRWLARGGSLNELERVTGWKSDRYVQRAERLETAS